MEITDQVIQKLAEILERLGLSAEIESSEIQDGDNGKKYLKLKLIGDNLSELIGFHGKRLESLENIVSLMCRDQFRDSNIRLVIDINNYKDQRVDQIRNMAIKAIMNVKESNQELELAPMKAFERRIVHMEVKSDGEIDSESIGEGDERRIVIKPKK